MQTRICFISFAARAHFWLVSNLVSTGIARTFSANLLSSCTAPGVYCYLESFLLQFRIFSFPLVEPHEIPDSPLLQLLGSFWMAAQPTDPDLSHSSQFNVIYKLAEGTLCHIIQTINKDVKQEWSQYWVH